MTQEELESGLADMGFIGIKNMGSMAYCNKDFKHWILYTDGLIIYTNYPWTHNTPVSDMYRIDWRFDDFSFEELESEMRFIEKVGAAEEIIPYHYSN